MASFNKVIMVGNLVADPELRQTPNGIPVTTIRIAVGRRFAKPDDAVQADFFDVVCWRQTAEFVARYFTKGRAILVSGSLQTSSWVDQTSQQRRYKTEIVADEVTFVDRASNESSQRNTLGDLPNYSSADESSFEDLSADDELPF